MSRILFSIVFCFFTSFLAYAQTPCNSVYYPFTSTPANISGVDSNTKVFNAVLTADRHGYSSSAYSFNGSNAYIDLGKNDLLKRYKTDFTTSAWVYLRSYSENYRSAIVSNRDTNSIGSGLSVGGSLDHPGKIKLEIQGGADASEAFSNTTLELNKWYFVAVTYTYKGGDTNIARIYINNQLETTTIVKDVKLPLSTPTYIGHEPSKLVSPLNHFNGVIDEVRIYNCALPVKEIEELFKDCHGVYYPFSGSAEDSSSNKIDGTVYQAVLTSDRQGYSNSAYSFNGTNAYIDLGKNDLLKRYKTDFTISAWVYLRSYSEDYRSAIVSNRDTNSIGSGLSVGGSLDHPGKIKLEIQGGADASEAFSNTTLELNKWYFVAVTYTYYGGDTNVAKIYINNQLETTTFMKDVKLPASTPTYIGHEPSKLVSPLNHFDGVIDEVRIYNCAWSEKEISKSFNDGTVLTSVSSAVFQNMLTVYPNPATDLVTIQGVQEGEFFIVNEMGQVLRQFNLNTSNNFSVDIAGLSNGIYGVVDQQKGNRYSKLVIVK